MAFLPLFPLGKQPYNITTSNELHTQIWREFRSLKYLKTKLNAKQSIDYWLGQAKIYYCDGIKSNWRSACLLYYYSFLNIAKALLVGKKTFTFKELNSTSIYHGFQTKPQDINDIIDYEITVYPERGGKGKNVFAYLYKIIIGKKWPFNTTIDITLKEILGYCSGIGKEIKDLFNIEYKLIHIQSLIRYLNNEVWYEMLIKDKDFSYLNSFINNYFTKKNINNDDVDDWMSAFNRKDVILLENILIRSKKYKYKKDDKQIINDNLFKEILKIFKYHAIYNANVNYFHPHWIFVPQITLNNNNLFWHPILSNYIISFALGSILRYQPQIIKEKTMSDFFCEAWCQQIPIEVLKYFLMFFTYPPIRITRD